MTTAAFPSLIAAVLILAAAASAQTTERVSVNANGGQGNNASSRSSISSDGRYVAFQSGASNLVQGDTNGVWDIFIHDRQSGQTYRASVDSIGGQGNHESQAPKISADGRFVAFRSQASNLVAGDTNALEDLFVHDRLTGQTERVNVDSLGAESDDRVWSLAISGDGRFVAFGSDATNLVPGDTNGDQDVFVHDRQLATTIRVSVDSAGTQVARGAGLSSISEDGRYVTFGSDDTRLVTGDNNNAHDLFLHDLITRETSRVSVGSLGAEGNDQSGDGSISADGRFVAFGSEATNLVPGDSNGRNDVFVHDRQSGIVSLISRDASGIQGNEDSYGPIITPDGRYVLFTSYATNFVTGDTNSRTDIFIHDRVTGSIERANLGALGSQCIDWCYYPSITADGRHISFDTRDTTLVSGDTNREPDVFVRDRGPALPVIGKSGACPGTIELTILDATPFGSVAVLYGPAGSTVQTSGPCVGLTVNLNAAAVAVVLTANAEGTAQHGMNAPLNVCGMSVQAVDLASCVATNVITLDTRTVNLAMTGGCDGPLSLTVTEATPGLPVAILYGPAGSFTKAGGACSGLTVGIAAPTVAGTRVADAAGVIHFGFYAPSGLCGMTVQAVDLTTCTLTQALLIEPRVLSLTKTGSCQLSHVVDLEVSNLTPGSPVALLYGAAGTHVKTGGACAGVSLGMASPTVLAVLTADAAGQALYSFTPPPALCGLTVQAVEHAACVVSNTVTLF